MQPRVSGRRAGLRFDAQHGVRTEALIFLGSLDPEAIGPSIEHATHYEPSPVGDVATLIGLVPIPLERATFLDLGSGMGRAVLLAARHPFRTVIGVEISPALHEMALRNVADFVGKRECRDVRLVRADAAGYAFPRGDLVVYLYNPFRGAVLERIAARLARRNGPHETIVVYHTPAERRVFDDDGAFELVAEAPCGALYRRVTTPSA